MSPEKSFSFWFTAPSDIIVIHHTGALALNDGVLITVWWLERREAEERNARYRLDQEKKRKDDVRKQLKESESLLLSEMSRLETHQDPARVADLSRRLGDIQKQLKAFDSV